MLLYLFNVLVSLSFKFLTTFETFLYLAMFTEIIEYCNAFYCLYGEALVFIVNFTLIFPEFVS